MSGSGAMPGSGDNVADTREGPDPDTSSQPPVTRPPPEERTTADPDRPSQEAEQIPERTEYQQWLKSQQEEDQQGGASRATVATQGGATEGPSNATGQEGSPGDPEASSLSALSNFSTGLSVDSDADSALGDLATPLSTSSVRSSIYEFVEEHGRTFHRYKQGKYWMPNDTQEQERLDLQHAVFLMLLKGKLGLAPIQNPQEVLDLGTGTGIWAIDFAQQYPSAQVIGTDLSPIQPDFVPSNCRFEVDDAEDDWVYPSYHLFDYVHLRLMFHTFRSHRRVVDSAFAHLRPGGWMEWQDYYSELQCVDDSMRGTALQRWVDLYAEGGKRLGRDMRAPRRYKAMMEEAGFVNVVEDKRVIPGNAWPRGRDMKRLGLWQMTNFLDGIHAVSMTIFTKGLGMSPEEVEVLLVEVRRDIKDLGVHFYFLTYFVYGQKPLEAKGTAPEA